MFTVDYSTNSKGTPVYTFGSGNKYTVTYAEDGTTITNIKKGRNNVTDNYTDDFVVDINDNDIPYYDNYYFKVMSFINKDGHLGSLNFNTNYQLVTFKDETDNVLIHYLPKHGNERYNTMVLNQINNVILNYPVGMVLAVDKNTLEEYTIEVMGGKVYSVTKNK